MLHFTYETGSSQLKLHVVYFICRQAIWLNSANWTLWHLNIAGGIWFQWSICPCQQLITSVSYLHYIQNCIVQRQVVNHSLLVETVTGTVACKLSVEAWIFHNYLHNDGATCCIYMWVCTPYYESRLCLKQASTLVNSDGGIKQAAQL